MQQSVRMRAPFTLSTPCAVLSSPSAFNTSALIFWICWKQWQVPAQHSKGCSKQKPSFEFNCCIHYLALRKSLCVQLSSSRGNRSQRLLQITSEDKFLSLIFLLEYCSRASVMQQAETVCCQLTPSQFWTMCSMPALSFRLNTLLSFTYL